jgi:hypothetical protein
MNYTSTINSGKQQSSGYSTNDSNFCFAPPIDSKCDQINTIWGEILSIDAKLNLYRFQNNSQLSNLK